MIDLSFEKALFFLDRMFFGIKSKSFERPCIAALAVPLFFCFSLRPLHFIIIEASTKTRVVQPPMKVCSLVEKVH